MQCKQETDGQDVLLVLEGDVTLHEVGSLKETVSQSLRETGNLRVDLTRLERTDLSLLQLLCATHRSALAVGKTVSLVDDNRGPIRDLAARYGFVHRPACAIAPQEICLWRTDGTYPATLDPSATDRTSPCQRTC